MYAGARNGGYTTTTEEEDDESTSSASGMESGEKESIQPPFGETFSISSSLLRSDRGSPVNMQYEDIELVSLPGYTEVSQIPTFSTVSGSMQQYVMKSPSTGMVTDV